MESVCVLLSSYNGEKYIYQQIESIMDQTFAGEITILIRDDGSSDHTLSILRNIHTKEKRRIQILEGKNIGPQKSFLELIRNAGDFDYYFFSDQDDIWYDNKINISLSGLKKCDLPACFCSNYDICYADDKMTKKQVLKNTPVFSPLKIIFYNQIPGCTIGFNMSLRDILRRLELKNVMMHDSMVLSLAASVGEIIYSEESTIMHRIHGDNVVGEGHKKIIPHVWIKEKIKLLLFKEDYDVSEMASEFIKTGKIKKEWLNDLYLLRDFKKNYKNTLRLLKHPDSNDAFMDRTTLSIRCKILFHLF